MIGRDDLPTAVEWDGIVASQPEQRHFIFRVKAALSSRGERERLRNGELRRIRKLYPGMTVSGAAKAIELAWIRYLSAAWNREDSAGRPPDGSNLKREALWRLSVLTNGQVLTWRSIVTIFEAGEIDEV